jgi:hypothetical protein
MTPGGPATAQEPADSVRQAALRDFHGADLQGKDGPLARAGLDLLLLYHEHRHREDSDAERFMSERTGLEVRDGTVVVDATAAGAAEQLRHDLEALGMIGAEAAGGLVSGRLPVDRIPEAARLESLRGLMPSRAQTQAGRGQLSEAGSFVRKQPAADTVSAPERDASGAGQAGESSPPEAPEERGAGATGPDEEASGEEASGEEASGEKTFGRKGGEEASAGAAPSRSGSSDKKPDRAAGRTGGTSGGGSQSDLLAALGLALAVVLIVES